LTKFLIHGIVKARFTRNKFETRFQAIVWKPWLKERSQAEFAGHGLWESKRNFLAILKM